MEGAIFRVTVSTLQLLKWKGGWGLINVEAKCKMLYTYRFQINRTDGMSITALWLRTWGLQKREANPPHAHRIPLQLEYLRIYAQDSAYIPDKVAIESTRAYKCKLYTTICLLLMMETETSRLRVMRMWPNADWTTVWTNIHEAPIPETAKVTWFKVIHDIIPTRARLHTIRLSPTDKCEHCTQTDTLRHRITECGVTSLNWERTRKLIAIILRTDWRTIHADWLIRPTLKLWPPKRHRAVLWMLAMYIMYCMQRHRELLGQDYYEFLRRARWKTDKRTDRDKLVGNYLSVIPGGDPSK